MAGVDLYGDQIIKHREDVEKVERDLDAGFYKFENIQRIEYRSTTQTILCGEKAVKTTTRQLLITTRED